MIECLRCGAVMRAEHAHHKCDRCGWRTTCCEGAPLPAGGTEGPQQVTVCR